MRIMNNIEVKIVVGSNYGDEGKGLATRYFTRNAVLNNKSCLNVLYNGGPQRGHTVEMIEGAKTKWHVCHHIGAGSFDGAATYFDENFMVNPLFYIYEMKSPLNIIPEKQYKNMRHYISPNCRVITPYDCFINQIVEVKRNTSKHGSCGHGIWETQKRYESLESAPKYGDLANWNYFEIESYLRYIANDYLNKRLDDYGIKEIPTQYKELIESKELRQHYISDLYQMMDMTTMVSFEDLVGKYDSIVFEGAQGLALDEDNVAMYPHVTASKTGSSVPVKRMKPYHSNIEVCYVTRTYFTRHGAGPFPTECPVEKINEKIQDVTNIDNTFQGSIRYGLFDEQEFFHRVNNDFNKSRQIRSDIKRSLFLTHLNYTDGLTGGCEVEKIKLQFDALYYSATKFAEDVFMAK